MIIRCDTGFHNLHLIKINNECRMFIYIVLLNDIHEFFYKWLLVKGLRREEYWDELSKLW